MKICKLSIIAFGKLKNEVIDCEKDFNSFIKNNGEGKSTIFNFILAMFYGAGKNTISDLRKLYIPWNEKSASGSIEFIFENKRYRLDRTFGKTKKNDISSLYDLQTGSKVNVPDDEFGEYFFHLDKDSFKATLFIQNKDLVVEATTNLNNLLINTINTGNAATSFEEAKSRLNEFEKIVNENNRFSQTHQLVKERYELNKKVEELYLKNEEVQTKLNENKKYVEQIEALKIYENECYQAISYQQEKSDHDKYMHYLQLKRAHDDNALNQKEADLTDYQSLLQRLYEVGKKEHEKNSPLHIIIAVVLLIVSIALGVLLHPAFFAIASLSIVFIGIHFKLQHDVKVKNDKIDADKKNLFHQLHSETFEGAVAFIQEKMRNQKKQYVYDDTEYITFITSNNVLKLAEHKSFEPNIKLERIADPTEKLKDVSIEIRRLQSMIDKNVGYISSFNVVDELSLSLSKIADLDERIKKNKELNEYLQIAKYYVEQAKDEVYSNFTPGLRKILIEELSAISNGKFVDLVIDSSLNVLLDEGNNLHEIDYYSQGYKDMVYIALRVAILKLALTKEALPVFLDDPFVNLDENNKKLAMEYLNKLSTNNQIFYFSCHL